ncbi:predicted protein [Bathycoccus prasinos]|uniref:PsbP C-terminal domain-containing protein n=1 Tax=Bathycoccus prasinos TaxID=41875 RepID=K8F4J8_9CHLO|nr:predicted protein [Bathycoccus prasinos]CCO19750.1 predicted protein [Bathycoccus prasinos]|eukprot:XP_007509293.1 predicted protein [Bathycoccus prasinos]
MYSTRLVFKSGGTLKGKTDGARSQSKKITTVSSSSPFFCKDFRSPIISHVKRASSCFMRLHSHGVKAVRFERENSVPSLGALQRSAQVGAYLPESFEEVFFQLSEASKVNYPIPKEGFYQFSADSSKTPALRAGALDRYSVSFPPRWKELPVSNAKSGNYCQPRCDEATTEVGFSDPAQGTLQIIIIPTTKLLISKKFPSMGDVGTISNVINAISPAITGSVAAEEEEILDKEEFTEKGRVYYQVLQKPDNSLNFYLNFYKYELLTPFAETGLHNIAKITTSQNYVIMASISASEAQWSANEKTEVLSYPYFLVTLSKDETPITAAAIAASTTPPATTDNNVFFKEGVMAAVSLIASLIAKEGATKLAVLRETAALIFSTFFATFEMLATGVEETYS